MLEFPVYVDYTSDLVTDSIKKYGFKKLATRCLQLQGTPIDELTEKTAGTILQSAMSVHLSTKKYLDKTRESVNALME